MIGAYYTWWDPGDGASALNFTIPACWSASILCGGESGAVGSTSVQSRQPFAETLDGIEAVKPTLGGRPLARAACGLRTLLGVRVCTLREAGERWTCGLKMLAQMASISPS